MDNISIAKKYFEFSNQSNMQEILKLMTNSTTYSSPSTGMYLGVEDIIAMQEPFHKSFEKLNWKVTDYSEEKPGIVLCNFNFEGTKTTGEEISFSAREYIIIFEGKIQHVEIR